ncbi:MAG: metalloregulator ArsR/SmtB family transcription factor [Ginsengibacter sp.]
MQNMQPDIQSNQMAELTLHNDVRKAGLILRALDHPLRQIIVDHLAKNPNATVTNLIERLQQKQSIVSQHLAILRRAKIVYSFKKAKFVHYYVNAERINETQALVSKLLNGPQ